MISRFARVLAAGLTLALGCSASLPPGAPSAALGQSVSFELPSDRGALVPLPQPGARATVIDAWAPTCVPCRDKVPALFARRAELEAAGARLVLVAVLSEDETTEAARAALKSWGVDSPFLVDRGGVLRRECAIEALPATAVIAAGGRVRWLATAESTAADVVAATRAVTE